MVYRHDFDALNQLNSDCIGWVRIPDTGIDYPVMHTPDEPEKYLNKNYDGYFSYSGVPFLDARCTTYNTNMIIYGHNMSTGTMFAPPIIMSPKAMPRLIRLSKWKRRMA